MPATPTSGTVDQSLALEFYGLEANVLPQAQGRKLIAFSASELAQYGRCAVRGESPGRFMSRGNFRQPGQAKRTELQSHRCNR